MTSQNITVLDDSFLDSLEPGIEGFMPRIRECSKHTCARKYALNLQVGGYIRFGMSVKVCVS